MPILTVFFVETSDGQVAKSSSSSSAARRRRQADDQRLERLRRQVPELLSGVDMTPTQIEAALSATFSSPTEMEVASFGGRGGVWNEEDEDVDVSAVDDPQGSSSRGKRCGDAGGRRGDWHE